MEKNAREVREEQEAERQRTAAAKAVQEAADEAARARADVATKVQAETAAAAQAGEALRDQPPQLVIPLRTVVPAPEVSGGAARRRWRCRQKEMAATSRLQRGKGATVSPRRWS